jgi:hypothetical protein
LRRIDGRRGHGSIPQAAGGPRVAREVHQPVRNRRSRRASAGLALDPLSALQLVLLLIAVLILQPSVRKRVTFPCIVKCACKNFAAKACCFRASR